MIINRSYRIKDNFVEYQSIDCRVLKLGRNALFPETLCFNSVMVETPISVSLCLSMNSSLKEEELCCSTLFESCSGEREKMWVLMGLDVD